MAERSLPAGLNASTFPAKLWRLVNNPRVRSLRWDSRGQGLLIDRSLFERELLSSGSAQAPAPHTFRATQFRSFVRQLYRYGFRKVPGWLGSAVPGDCGGWLHFRNPNFLRDRPDLLLHVQRRSTANRQRQQLPRARQQLPRARPLTDGPDGRSRFKALPRERPPLPPGRPPSGFLLLHRERPLPDGRELRSPRPGRLQQPASERPLLVRRPPCSFHLLHRERPVPARREGPSRFQELYGEQLPPAEREVLRIQPCSLQQLHREQQPPASDPPATPGPLAPSAPPGSAGCAPSTASSSAWNAPAEEESPAADLGLELEKMIREIRRSLPQRSPCAQGNVNVAPKSSEEEALNRAAAEEASPGTKSCRNSSSERGEPDPI